MILKTDSPGKGTVTEPPGKVLNAGTILYNAIFKQTPTVRYDIINVHTQNPDNTIRYKNSRNPINVDTNWYLQGRKYRYTQTHTNTVIHIQI